jgi:plasmid stabilization system protein ParE
MTEYSVEITDAAFVAIRRHARYIAVESQAPQNAARWLERIWDAIESLEQWPRRAPMAAEDALVSYEVRQLVIDNHFLLFTIDDGLRKVWILGLRHGHRLPRPQDLPPTLVEEEPGDSDD